MLPVPIPDTVPNRWPPSANIWIRRNGKRRTRRFPWWRKSLKISRAESTKRQKRWKVRPLRNSSELGLNFLRIFGVSASEGTHGRLLPHSRSDHEACAIFRKENLLHALFQAVLGAGIHLGFFDDLRAMLHAYARLRALILVHRMAHAQAAQRT